MIKYPFTRKYLPHGTNSSDYSAEIEWFNDDKSISYLYPIIDNKTFHRCSLESFISIMKDGFILPNLGQFEFTYPQSETNIGGQNKWVSLFNFNKSPFEIMTTYCDWRQFLTDRSDVTILIILKDEFISQTIKNPFCGNKNLTTSHCIAYVEEWSEVPISVENFETIVFVQPHRPRQYISCSWENVKKSFLTTEYKQDENNQCL